MSGTPDILTQFGGQPVGADHRFDGWWGGKVYFIDFDNGTAGATGLNDMADPGNDMQRALDDEAAADASIYVRPRAFAAGTYGEDPQQITPSSDDAENFHVDKARKNLSLIGTGKGLGHAAAHKCWIGGYGALVTPVLDIRSPGCVIENFRAQPSNTATSGIFYTKNAGGIWDGGNTTFINNDFHGANTSGGIYCDSPWQMHIVGNRFLNNDVGILVQSLYSVPQIWQIRDNDFIGITSEVQNDIYATGGIKRLVCTNNEHTCGIPALGGTNVYIKMGAASTGAVTNSRFGAEGTTDTTFMTLNGLLQSGNHSSDALIVT